MRRVTRCRWKHGISITAISCLMGSRSRLKRMLNLVPGILAVVLPCSSMEHFCTLERISIFITNEPVIEPRYNNPKPLSLGVPECILRLSRRFDGRGEVGHVSPSSQPVLDAGPERGRDKPCFAGQFSYKFLSAKVSYRCALYTVARIQALLSSHSCPEGKGRAPHPEWTLRVLIQ